MPLPQCVIGSGGKRTRIAIDRYWLLYGYDINDEDHVKEFNKLYRRRMDLGCPVCGTVKRFGIGLCRRCYLMQPRLREMNLIIGTSVSYPIWKVRREFQAFAKRMANDTALSRSQKLTALLEWKPENYQS